MKRNFYLKLFGVGILAGSLLLAGCTPEKSQGSESTPNPNASTDQTQVAWDYSSTKNTTRIVGKDAEELSISTSRMIWPATQKGTIPNVVLVAPKESWQAQLVSLDLVHHPSDGPLLVTSKNQISSNAIDEIMRLNPRGSEDGTQVITIGMDEEAVKQLSDHFKVKEIKGETPSQLAEAIDQFYAEASGSLPASVIVSTSEQVEFAAPAGNWISHMPEPLLYVTKDEIPNETINALQKREGKATVYLLGPESVISKTVEENLRSYGTVIRIAGDDPVSNAIAFAQYKDTNTGFGWGITQPGHGLLLGNMANMSESIPTGSFAHRGKHAPLLLTNADSAPDNLVNYLTKLKPLFEKEPTEGPYNHLYIVGGSDWISWEQQGNLDHLIEIESVTGDSHAGHGGGHQEPSQPEKPAKEEQPVDHGKMNHNGHH
ncbi:cell wall-binding repeat-containing protein [Ammoniphilus sp. CFH 90114]|uniref:cell wall-binding repeat-containing protein n=1 Tax=Ammoniphilus sp. CFH 90114 TaxID=2493665 RepID=UPI00100E231D|nr:cell wall-binding repeat-containing protein [Ammoniphilus sp. CFH 90114]RXT05648.1 cell wall-binding repeat-containing protein [Ammoniphilus sp. CFH 90114]